MPKRVIIAIAAILAAAAVVVGVTVIPAVSGDPRSELKTLTGRFDQSGRCADITFEATLAYSLARPLIDPWGIARVENLSLNDAALSVEVPSGCGDVGTIASDAMVEHPDCDHSRWEGDPQGDANEDGFAVGCGGYTLFYAVHGDPGAPSATMRYSWDQALPDSGLVRSDWCLRFGAAVTYDNTSDTAVLSDGDLCIDVSS